MATSQSIMMTHPTQSSTTSHKMKLSSSGGGSFCQSNSQNSNDGRPSSHNSMWKKRIKIPMSKIFRRSLSSRQVDDDDDNDGRPAQTQSSKKLSRKKHAGFAGALRRSFSAGQLVGLSSSSSSSRRSRGRKSGSDDGDKGVEDGDDSDGNSTSSNSNDKSVEMNPPRENNNRTNADLFDQYQMRLRQQQQQQEQERLLQQRKTSSQSNSVSVIKKSVQFNENVIVQEIPHIRDMSNEELHSVWMKGDEFISIRSSCRTIVNNIDNGNIDEIPPEGFALLRGLDQHMKNYKQRREEIHSQVHEAVFRLQRFQTLSGVNMSEEISKACIKYSEPALIAAHMAAISDLFTAFKDTWTQRHIPTVTANPKPIPGSTGSVSGGATTSTSSIINDYQNQTPSLGGLLPTRRTQSLQPSSLSTTTTSVSPQRSMSTETPEPTLPKDGTLPLASSSTHSNRKPLILLTPKSAVTTMMGERNDRNNSSISSTFSHSSSAGDSSYGSDSDCSSSLDDDDDDDDSSVTSLLLDNDDDLLCLVQPSGLPPVMQPAPKVVETEVAANSPMVRYADI